MSLRTTSTGIPRTSMRWRLVLTLVLHDLEDFVHHSRISTEHRVDGVANLAFFEPIAAPVRLLHLANRAIQCQSLHFFGIRGWFRAVMCRSFSHHRHPRA